MSFLDSGTCDVCLCGLSRPAGYLLTTTEVVSAPGYWRSYYELHKQELVELQVHSYEEFCRAQPVFRTVFGIAAMDTPWLVCDRCILLFGVDHTRARDYAARWWRSRKWWRFRWTFRPPSSGAADISAINMGDGKRWRTGEDYLRSLEGGGNSAA